VTRGCDATVVRGDPESRSFSVVYLRGGRIAAIDSVNVMRDFAQGRGLVAAAASVEPSRLADPDTPLRELLLPVRTCAPAT
jgi:3-phenylpropionate/trans-cinnamate dioxygenase ferredoxin reductase component